MTETEREPVRVLQEELCFTNPVRDLLYALRYKKCNVQATMQFLMTRMSSTNVRELEKRQLARRLAMSEADEISAKQARDADIKRLRREGDVCTALDGIYSDSALVKNAVVAKFLSNLPSVPDNAVQSKESQSASVPSSTLPWEQAIREPIVRTLELEGMAYKWFPRPSEEYFRATVLPRVENFVLNCRYNSESTAKLQFLDFMRNLVRLLEKNLFMTMSGLPEVFQEAQRTLNERMAKELEEDGIEILDGCP